MMHWTIFIWRLSNVLPSFYAGIILFYLFRNDKLDSLPFESNLPLLYRYAAGRTHLIMQRETSGLNTFVGKFSLPSLIFLSICKLNLSEVNWLFIFAIFVSKTAIFFLVLVITILVTRPTNTARAGLLAIFCTQTNDFAIGVPIGKYLHFHVFHLIEIF